MTDREVLKKMAANPGLNDPLPDVRSSQAQPPAPVHDRLGLVGALQQQLPSLRRLRRLSVHDRASSDSNLAHPDLHRWPLSSLAVSRHEVTLRPDTTLVVHWDIKDSVSASDCIATPF